MEAGSGWRAKWAGERWSNLQYALFVLFEIKMYNGQLELWRECYMDLFFLVLIVLMLVLFGYAQLQKGVFRIPGKITFNEEEELEIS